MIITSVTKKWDETCTTTNNLIQNAATRPVIREVLEYAEPRMLSTMLVSGAKYPYDLSGNRTKTKIGVIPNDQKIGSNGYRYRKYGRIDTNVIINHQVGTSSPDGYFQLSLRTNYLVPGMNVKFYAQNFLARVVGLPTGGGSNWIYTFQSIDGTVFDWNTMVAPQPGEKTCYGMFTTYGEASMRGYGRTFYPDELIGFLTTQRKAVSISGTALNEVTWVTFGEQKAKGWWYSKLRQARLQFLMEDERAKWFGRTNMKDPITGELLPKSNLLDHEAGEDIIQGDGVIAQIEGGNEMWGSGPDGFPTIDDYRDMMKTLSKKSHNGQMYGKRWAVICGTDAYQNAQKVIGEEFFSTGGRINVNASTATGGPEVAAGANFTTIHWLGNSMTFVEHPLFDDELIPGPQASDGSRLLSGISIILEMTNNNVEILTNGDYGTDRSLVIAEFEGMTGRKGSRPVTPQDKLTYELLKHDGIFIYCTESCGIIHRSMV